MFFQKLEEKGLEEKLKLQMLEFNFAVDLFEHQVNFIYAASAHRAGGCCIANVFNGFELLFAYGFFYLAIAYLVAGANDGVWVHRLMVHCYGFLVTGFWFLISNFWLMVSDR